MKKSKRIGILIIMFAVAFAFFAVLAYFFTPSLGIRPSTILLLACCLAVSGLIFTIIGDSKKNPLKLPVLPIFITAGGLVAIVALLTFIGSPVFNAKKYSSSVNISFKTAEDAAEVIPTLDKANSIALMDSKSARKLGDRTLGTLADYVSQYEVAAGYSTISYQGRIVKVAPLEYGGFWKAMKNSTIPGYVIVDVVEGEARFVEVEGGMKYSMSAYFNSNAFRKAWLNNPTVIMDRESASETTGGYTNVSFQLDEEGVPYYVFTTFEYATLLNCKVPNGINVLNACTGEVTFYSLSEIPEWIELTFSGDEVELLYNRYGRYLNGFINFSKTGETRVTDDYGYLENNGDIYIYTGVTSVGGDESNIGFLLVNSRTGEFNFYPIAGAEEYSAMSAAEGLVQNYGYSAAFPALIMVNDIPTYVMCLRDNNLLVKQYAMVNVSNYSIVAVADSLEATNIKYLKALGVAGTTQSVNTSELIENKTITLSEIIYLTVDQEPMVYWKDSDNNVYRQSFTESLLFYNVGDTVTVSYYNINGIRVIK